MKLLDKTYVENFETGNIKYTDEVSPLKTSLKSLVTLLHEPLEDTIEHSLSQGTDGVRDLILVPTLGDELVTDLDLGLGQELVQVHTVNTEELANSLTNLFIERLKPKVIVDT